MAEIKMEGITVDKKKPLWWVVLVTFCMVFIYSIGISPENDDYADEFNPNVVENLNGVFSLATVGSVSNHSIKLFNLSKNRFK